MTQACSQVKWLNVKLFSSLASSVRSRVGVESVLSILLVACVFEWDMAGGWWAVGYR